MADKKIKLLVQAEVKKAVQALNRVEKEQKDIKKQNDGLKKSFAAMGGIIASAFSIQVIARFTQESIKLGSQTVSLTRSFTNLGKAVNINENSLNKFRKATDGTVSDVDLMIQANNAMLLGIVDNEDAFAELIDNAQRLAKAVGQDALFGIESLTTGIGRQSKLMLDNLGIVLDTNLAYQKFAEANGKAVKDLDENERKQAFVQAALESTAEKVAQLGAEQLDATDATNRLAAAYENLQANIGKELQDEVEVVTGQMSALLTILNEDIEEKGLLGTLLSGRLPIGLGGIPALIDPIQTAINNLPPVSPDTARVFTPSEDFASSRTLIGSEDTAAQAERLQNEFIVQFGATEDMKTQILADAASRRQEILREEQLGEIPQEIYEASIKAMEISEDAKSKLIEDHQKRRRKVEAKAHKERIQENLQTAILSGQSAKEAALSVVKAEIAEAQAGLISSIMKSLPFPINLAVAAGAGAMIGKVTDKLFSFQTGGSFVTKGRTTLPIGNGVVVGDNASGMERIDVTPLPAPPSGSERNITVNISAPLVDETVVDHIIPAIRRAEQLNL